MVTPSSRVPAFVSLVTVAAMLLAAQCFAAEPATPQAAARVLDLRTFPRVPGVGEPQMQTLGMLLYEAPVAAKVAFDFQSKKLLAAGWKERPGAYKDANNQFAQYTKDGYQLSVSASSMMGEPGKESWSRVSVINHGNVQANKLPVPMGVKPFASSGGDASYLTDAKVADAAAECRKLLTAAGWTPYGSAGSDDMPMLYFKRNAIRLMAWVSTAPAQGNKTMIRYSTELLSADLPVPPDAPDPRYNDDDKSLSFDYPGEDSAPVVTFYQQALPKLGWKATTDEPVVDQSQRTEFLIFRNADSDMITLDMQHFNEIVRTEVKFDTAAEVKENERRAKEAAKRELAKRDAAKQHDSEPQLPPGVKMPDLPDTDNVDELLKAAQKMADDAIGEARGALKQAGGSAPKATTAATGPAKVADIPMPKGAGVEYNKIVKMIKVVSADDVRTLAQFFLDSLPQAGWRAESDPLVTDTSAILKFSRGDARLTVMAGDEDGGSEATVMCKGVNWDKTPSSRAATRLPIKIADSDREDSDSEDMPADEDRSDSDEPKPVKLKYAAKIPAGEQKQTGATGRFDKRTVNFAYGVAYQAVSDGEQKTEVLLSTKPINVDKLVALLNNGQDGGDSLGFDEQLKLRYDDEGKLSYVFLYADGLSVNLGGPGEDKVASQFAIEGDHARGTARLVEPEKLFDHECSFTAAFDVKLIVGKPVKVDAGAPESTEELAGEDFNGLPIPLITTSRASTSSPFRTTIEVTIPAPLTKVIAFYRNELAKAGWKEDPSTASITGESAAMNYTSNRGPLSVKLASQGDDTVATLATRDAAKARAAGIAPQAGKGLLILGNGGAREAVVVINGQPYKVAAGKGAENPKDGVLLHVLPGNYSVSVKSAGEAGESQKLRITTGETWGVIVLPTGGYFADQVY